MLHYKEELRMLQACSSSLISSRVMALWWFFICQFCTGYFSATTDWNSSKLDRMLHYQEELRILPACSGSLISSRVMGPLMTFICQSCSGYFSATIDWNSSKLHGMLHYQEELCIFPACSGSLISSRVMALWWFFICLSCQGYFSATTHWNSLKLHMMFHY